MRWVLPDLDFEATNISLYTEIKFNYKIEDVSGHTRVDIPTAFQGYYKSSAWKLIV